MIVLEMIVLEILSTLDKRGHRAGYHPPQSGIPPTFPHPKRSARELCPRRNTV